MRLALALLAISAVACDDNAPAEPAISGERVVEQVDALHRVDAWAHYKHGDYAAFTAALEAITEKNPLPKDVYNLACGYALTGQPEKAIERLTWLVDRGTPFLMLHDEDLDSLRERPDFIALVGRLETYDKAEEYLRPARKIAMKHYRAGDHEAFILIMEKLAPLSDDHIDTYNLACAYALSGRNDEAIAALERLADVGKPFKIADDPDFDGLRGDPRFEKVLARL
ncbi:MAG: hypothetical protein EP330_27615 [Deltaproteobacteria bacterium]|nr:MAG: hypothetical protein EP330_27615 [Deltaproteobacteria bacterium]